VIVTRLRPERAASKTVPALALALLAACAGGQKPRPAAAPGAAAEPAPAAPAAVPQTGLPGDAPAPLGTSAKGPFEEGVQKETAGDLAGAAAAFERAFKAEPGASFAGVNAGVLRERLGEPAAAQALYAKVLDQNPSFFPAAQNLVRLEARRGKADDAEAQMRARLEKSPDAVALRNGLAEALLAQGKLDPAEAAARQALKLDEKNVPAMVNLATVYARKQRFELAKMVLENARQIDQRDAAVWNRLGFVELALGDRPQALESFRTAAALRPDYPEAHANYGALLADAEDFGAAAVELETAVKYAPQSAHAWLDLGNAYRGLKQFDKAEEAYRKSLQLDAKQPDCQFNLAVLYLDGEKPGMAPLQRLQQGVAYLDAYEQAGGKDAKVVSYRKDAARSIEREKKRLEREEKDRLRREAEAKKKAETEAQPAAAPAPAAAGGAKPAAAPAAAPKAEAVAAPVAAPPKKKAGAKKQPVKPSTDKGAAPPQGAERGDK
jgi:tetratricopeptide (TPR) repeat protein